MTQPFQIYGFEQFNVSVDLILWFLSIRQRGGHMVRAMQDIYIASARAATSRDKSTLTARRELKPVTCVDRMNVSFIPNDNMHLLTSANSPSSRSLTRFKDVFKSYMKLEDIDPDSWNQLSDVHSGWGPMLFKESGRDGYQCGKQGEQFPGSRFEEVLSSLRSTRFTRSNTFLNIDLRMRLYTADC